MSKRLTAINVAYYITHSPSREEIDIFRSYLQRHPKMKSQVERILRENELYSGQLLKNKSNIELIRLYEGIKSEPYKIGHRKIEDLSQLTFF